MSILGTFVLCSVLIFMIDFVEMLRQSGKFGEVPAWKLAYITLLRLPAYTEFLLSFAVLVGAIGALLMLSRKSELTVMRAGGMSAWQFLWPGMTVAALLGTFAVVAYNPLAASARSEGERLFAEAFGRESNLLRNDSGGSWLRQDGTDGASVPFWSPDSQHIGFFSQGKLQKIAMAGGPPQTLCDAPTSRGGAWSPNGVIIFNATGLSPISNIGLMRVSAG